jgi:acetoin utilization deacetylase AcuC-like enzyme
MLISIHRYDRGTFYPSEPFADVTSQGLGDAEGTKINLPLDYVD